MPEQICALGHVIDNGRSVCSRCNSPAIGTVEVSSVVGETTATAETTTIESENTSTEDSSVTLENFEELTVEELKSELITREIEFDNEDHKADLQKKLKKALKKEVL